MAPNNKFKKEICEEEEIICLVSARNYQQLINKHTRNKFLPWVWPSKEDLQFIGESTQRFGANRIVSIGCGSGLLEWLIQQVTGLPVKGVEVDKSWWASKYNRTFIPLEFAEDFNRGYQATCKTDALMFCYFNNGVAFLDYLRHYDGSCLIVIGPGEGRGTHTEPTPFLLPSPADVEWSLKSLKEISSGKDFIGIFNKIS